MSIRRSIFLGALAAPLVAFACGPDPFPIEHLGVVDGGTSFDAPFTDAPHPTGLPPAKTGLDTACGAPSPFSVAAPATSAFGGLSSANGRIVLSVDGRGYTFGASASDGCPAAATAGPYQQGLGAVAFDGTTVWAASPAGVLALSSSGALVATCVTSARGLAGALAGGGAYAIDGASFGVLSLVGGQCAVTAYALPAPSIALAVAASTKFPGALWLATSSGVGAPRVARFDAATGAEDVTTRTSLEHVCDVSSIAEIGDRLVAVDPTCSRVWAFHILDPLDTTPPTSAALTPGLQPVAIAPSPTSANEALVAEQAAITASSSVVQLSRLVLP